jgi:hypothetical protein
MVGTIPAVRTHKIRFLQLKIASPQARPQTLMGVVVKEP